MQESLQSAAGCIINLALSMQQLKQLVTLWQLICFSLAQDRSRLRLASKSSSGAKVGIDPENHGGLLANFSKHMRQVKNNTPTKSTAMLFELILASVN
jgi:hypothetical protein